MKWGVPRTGGLTRRPFAVEIVSAAPLTTVEVAGDEQVVSMLPPSADVRIDRSPTPAGPVEPEVEVTAPLRFLRCDPTSPTHAAAVFRSLAGWAVRERSASS